MIKRRATATDGTAATSRTTRHAMRVRWARKARSFEKRGRLSNQLLRRSRERRAGKQVKPPIDAVVTQRGQPERKLSRSNRRAMFRFCERRGCSVELPGRTAGLTRTLAVRDRVRPARRPGWQRRRHGSRCVVFVNAVAFRTRPCEGGAAPTAPQPPSAASGRRGSLVGVRRDPLGGRKPGSRAATAERDEPHQNDRRAHPKPSRPQATAVARTPSRASVRSGLAKKRNPALVTLGNFASGTSASSQRPAVAVPADRLDRARARVRAAAGLDAAEQLRHGRCRSARCRSWPRTTTSQPRCCSTTTTAWRSEPRPRRRCCAISSRERRRREQLARQAPRPAAADGHARSTAAATRAAPSKKRPAGERSKRTRRKPRPACVQQALWASYPASGAQTQQLTNELPLSGAVPCRGSAVVEVDRARSWSSF